MSRQQVIVPGDGLARMLTTNTTPVTTWSSDINPVLEQYGERPGQPYLSPMHILSRVGGPYGVPYWMQGLAVQTCTTEYITAPEADQKSVLFHSADTLSQKPLSAFGQAPTSGIYTGVESEVCT